MTFKVVKSVGVADTVWARKMSERPDINSETKTVKFLMPLRWLYVFLEGYQMAQDWQCKGTMPCFVR